jgi:photosystem II stability/assembly factor-like uncharacterized protein
MAADLRGPSPKLYAAANHWAWGPSVARSDDLGKTWDYRGKGLGFPQDMGVTIGNVWHVEPGHASEPGVVFAGTQPAGMFRSEDWGQSWTPVDSFNRHETRQYWQGTGSGDSSLHSIEIDPRDAKRIYAAISSGGTFLSEDGGASWRMISHTAISKDERSVAFIKGLQERFGGPTMPDLDPLALDEFHKLRMDRKNPDRLWGQAHVGVFRSDDGGATWDDVTGGLPSFHGFPIAVTKGKQDAAFVVPIAYEGMYDNFRVCDGQFAVYRTRDGGKTWERMTKGLPGPHDYQSAYRESMDTDGLDSEGVYVGTTNGQVFASTDCGDSWQQLPGRLPPILSVTAFAA